MAHKNLYGEKQEAELTKEIQKIPKEVSVQDRRKYEILIRSGVTGKKLKSNSKVRTSHTELQFTDHTWKFLGHSPIKDFWDFTKEISSD